jgi:integrase
LSRTLAPRTVRHHRQVLAQVVDEAVKIGALVGNPVRAVKPLRVGESDGGALDRDQTRALLGAVGDHRLGAAVGLLFLQGWRVSEVLGLVWEDLDLDAGTAQLRRASVYVDGRGQQLGPPKTAGAHGEHWLMPTTVALLRERWESQAQERAVAPGWETTTYEGEPVSLVFTTPAGGLVLRQSISKIVKQAARTAGITADLGTHAGRRTVVTTLFVDGDEALGDIAHFVGHARPTTTAGYVKRLGRRPQVVAKRAAAVLDGQGDGDAADSEGVRNDPPDLGSTARATGLHRRRSGWTPTNRKPWSDRWSRTDADPSGPRRGCGFAGIRPDSRPTSLAMTTQQSTSTKSGPPRVRQGYQSDRRSAPSAGPCARPSATTSPTSPPASRTTPCCRSFPCCSPCCRSWVCSVSRRPDR